MTARTLKCIVGMLAIGLASVSLTEAGQKYAGGDPLVVLAIDVEDTARYIQHRAERLARHGTYHEHRALVRLDWLTDKARDFNRTLHRFGPYSHRTQGELFELQRAFGRAKSTFLQVRAFRRVRNEFRQLDHMMDDLRFRMERRLARYDGRRGHAHPTRHGGSGGYVRIGKSWDGGHAEVGFVWDDEDEDRDY